MTLPSYVHFIGPLLEYLGEQKAPVRAREAYEGISARLNLSEGERAARLPSGTQPVFHNRIGWAQDALKRAGLSTAPARGTWLITDAGHRLLAENRGRIPEAEMARISTIFRDVAIDTLAVGSTGEADVPQPVPKMPIGDQRSPREQIEDALSQIRGSVARDILDALSKWTPQEFEDLVLDVLHALGYGLSRDALQRVGRSGDGGIDGIVPLDRLGLQKVYVQAKKWQGQVGSPEVQKFIGALQLQGADKGVLISAGDISGPARDAAKQARGSVVLIDGRRLAEIMIERGVGVSSEQFMIPRNDTDHFEA